MFKENISIKNYNSFKIDVKTKFFCEFKNIEELKIILNSCVYNDNKSIVLGGGSNILFTNDYKGLILKNNITGIKIIKENNHHIIVEVGSGENWHKFVMWSIEKNLSGIENLALIPGSVGACPVQNIGAYGMEAKDSIISVQTIDLKSNKEYNFKNKDCDFNYRDSIFKNKLKNKIIITKVTFRLNKKPINNISYGNIELELKKLKLSPSPKNIANTIIKIREKKLPDPKKIGNCGSFFKNPIISNSQFLKLQKKFPEIIHFKLPNKKIKISAGWLIENIGLKGYRKGDAGVHKQQALVIVNYGRANGKEILNLAKRIQKKVMENYEIKIEPEVNIL